MSDNKKINISPIIRKLAIEMLIYSILLIAYTAIVLNYIAEPMTSLFYSNLTYYAFIGLGLIVAQAVLLDNIVGFLIKLLGLGHSE